MPMCPGENVGRGWKPILQRPIAHGADLVIHSTTKYRGGHSEVLGGAPIRVVDRLPESDPKAHVLSWTVSTI